jgi:hypothetical protein
MSGKFLAGALLSGVLALCCLNGCQSPAPAPEASSQPVTEDQETATPVVSGTAPVSAPPEQETAVIVDPEPVQNASAADPVPVFSIEDSVFKYGDLKPLSDSTATFRFSNTGTADLKINEVKGCCGARHELDKELLAPGESATLSVIYKTGSPGPFKKNLYLYTNDPQAGRVQLTVEGQVIKTLEALPRKLKLFLNRENAGCRPIELKALDGQPFRIKNYLCTGECIRFDFDPNQAALTHVLNPVVDMEVLKSMSSPRGRIQINLDREDYDHVLIYFDLIPNYVVNPPLIFIFNADPARKEVRKISVLDNYVEDVNEIDFAIDKVTVEGGAVSLLSQEKINDGYQLKVEIQPPAYRLGESSFNDQILITLDSGEELKVSVRGFYAQGVMMKAQKENAP